MGINEGIVKIKVIGTGGAGGNAINDMITSGIKGVEFIAANTDAQDLNKSLADIRVQLGEKSTRGLGAGADPEVGRVAAEEDIEKLRIILEDANMVFITAGMGGGTGTGASPVIARKAKELGILTVAVVTRPFEFEGKKRKANSDKGIEELRKTVDALVVIPNQKLFELPDKQITFLNAFREANNILKIGIKGIADLMIGTGLINLDFADIRTTMANSGLAVLGFGEGEGENRAVKATEKAIQSPLLEKSINGASKILINITGSSNVSLQEGTIISEMVTQAAGKEAEDVMFGLIIDENCGDKIQVTVIANNFTSISENETDSMIRVDHKEQQLKENFSQNGIAINSNEVEIDPKEIDVPPWMRSSKNNE
ncbi:MAG: cell division protein FtsZ [Fusobacteriaceae bacterium]